MASAIHGSLAGIRRLRKSAKARKVVVPETEDILRRTLDGIEGDFEELREELLQDLENFDAELRFCVESLPQWLDLSLAHVRSFLKFPAASRAPAAYLGPLVVAHAAGELETFKKKWLGHEGELVALDFSEDAALARAFEKDLSALSGLIDTLEAEAHATSLAAQASLSHIRDEILADLEDEREQDTDALQELVSKGDLSLGRDARKEIAQLWEDQRARADTFLTLWAQLMEQCEVGLELAQRGFGELRLLLENVHQGLQGGYPILDDRGPTVRPSMALVLEDDESWADTPTIPPKAGALFDPYGDLPEDQKQDVDPEEVKALKRANFFAENQRDAARQKRAFLQDPARLNDNLVFASQQAEGPMVDFFDGEDEEIAVPFFEEKVTAPPIADLAASTPRSPYDVFMIEDSSSEVVATNPPPLIEEAGGATLPMMRTQPAPETRPEEEDEPQDELATLELERTPVHHPEPQEPMGATAPIMEAQPSEPEESEPVERIEAPGAPTRPSMTLAPEPEPEPRAPRPVVKRVRRGEAVRSRSVYAPVTTLSVVLTYGVPLAFVAGILVMASTYEGMASGHPLRSGSVTQVAVMLCFVWMLLAPWLLRWKMAFTGWRPHLLRRARARDEAEVQLDEERVEVGPWSIEFARAREASLGRWESGGERGWLLTLVDERGEVSFWCSECEEDEAWEGSNLPLEREELEGAWHLEESLLHELHEAALAAPRHAR